MDITSAHIQDKSTALIATLAIFVICLVTLATTPVQAQLCTFTNTGINFGAVDLSSGSRVRTTGTFTATCTGTPNQRIRVCAHFGSGTGGVSAGGDPRQMLSGINALNFNIYKDGAYTKIWGSSYWGYPPNRKGYRLRLNGSGNKTKNVTIRNEIYASQQSTPPGTYLSSFAGAHTLIAYAYDSVGNCNAVGTMNAVQVPFTVQADVIGTCTVTATDLNFGTAGVIATALDTTNTISVTCSSTFPYTIGLDGGLTGAADPTLRKMANGPNQITYGIYQDAARSIPWGDTIGTNTISATGTGSVQNYTGYGRVPTQSTPAPGVYSDTIVVTVTY